LVLGLALVIVVASLAYTYACYVPRLERGGFIEPAGSNLGLGLQKTIDEIRSSVDFGVPEIPPVLLRDVASMKVAPVSLIQAFGVRWGVVEYYSHGLTIMVRPRIQISRQQFTRAWSGGRPGRVRGQTAQISYPSGGTGFSLCIRKAPVQSAVEIGANGYHRHARSASIEWMEDREQISLSGPYHHSILMKLAEGLRFKSG
jgi:hypothetical protein